MYDTKVKKNRDELDHFKHKMKMEYIFSLKNPNLTLVLLRQ